MDVDSSLQASLSAAVADYVKSKLGKPDVECAAYQVVVDGEERIYEYPLSNGRLAFADVVQPQLERGVDIPKVESLAAVANDLWASCVRIQGPGNEPVYAFSKLTRGKVALDKQKKATFRIKASFDTSNSKLYLFEGQTIELPARVDCLFAKGTFFIFEKKSFERIVGAEEQFKANADRVIDELEQTGMIEGLDHMRAKSGEGTRLLRRLADVARHKGHQKLDAKRIEQIRQMAKEYDLKPKFSDDGCRLLIEDAKDVNLVVKLLDDSFVESRQTGHRYEASVKSRLR